jgi:poly(hydroxyalkanoate) depolymerase family esterase
VAYVPHPPADAAEVADQQGVRKGEIMKMRVLLATAIMICFGSNALAGALTGTGRVKSYRLSKAPYQGSKARDYKVYVPRGYVRKQAVPMVFALHGCNMDNQDAMDNWNWDRVADAHNVIVVFPFVTRYDEFRNRDCWGYWLPAHIHEGAGEVEDLHRMALQVESHYTIDPKRRYLIGFSSGGGMALAAAIAYNEYWAAGASVAGLPYGDGAGSVLWERFKSTSDYIGAIQSELDDRRVIPFMVIHSVNDEVVRLKAAELIRDSHLAVLGGDTHNASATDCSAEGIACTHTRYVNDKGETVVETVFFNGAVVGTQCGPLGCGHYYGGEDNDPEAWAYGTGPSTTQIAWAFFSRHPRR